MPSASPASRPIAAPIASPTKAETSVSRVAPIRLPSITLPASAGSLGAPSEPLRNCMER